MKKILLFLLPAALALAANTTIESLPTTAVLPAGNDYTIFSGATGGTRKFQLTGMTYLTATRTTLAALSITNVGDGVGILVLGATAAGDGGGASYYWSAASAATPNGNTVIQPASLPATGRWLKATGNIGFPGPSTIGGVFSNAGATHQWIRSINTDGTVTLSQPSAADISGLGSMSSQNSASVSITGGSMDGVVIGAVGPTTGRFTHVDATGYLGVGTGGTAFATIEADVVAANLRLFDTTGGGGSLILDSQFGFVAGRAGLTASGDLYLKAGGSVAAIFSSAGLNSAVIGATTPAAGTFTTLASNSNANVRATKGNFHLTVNVKDYGAVGDGSADDTAAINAAIAALVDYSSLYFPPGTYKITGSLAGFTGLDYVRVYGAGARIFSNVTGAAGNTFVADATCTHISFDSLAIMGSATVRGSGIHIRLYAAYSSVTNCYLSGCSDFAIHATGVGARIENNTIVAPLGDGIHFGEAKDFVCVGNNISNTGDDGIGIVADTLGLNPERGTVVGNSIYNSASAGIRVDEANDILLANNSIETTAGAGIEVNRYLSTSFYSARINIKSNKLVNTQTTLGPRGAIIMDFANESSVTENEIYDPANGSGISFLDFNDLTIRGNTVRGSPSRAIASDDTTTANVAASWFGLLIDANVVQWNQANEAIYIVPASGKTIFNVIVTSNIGNALPSGNWVYYDRVTTGKVGNNTSRDGRAVAAGGTVSGVTAFNNN